MDTGSCRRGTDVEDSQFFFGDLPQERIQLGSRRDVGDPPRRLFAAGSRIAIEQDTFAQISFQRVVATMLPDQFAFFIELNAGEDRDPQLLGCVLSLCAFGVEREESDVGAVSGGAGERVLDVDAALPGLLFEEGGFFLPDGLGFLCDPRIADRIGVDFEDDESFPSLNIFILSFEFFYEAF